MQRHTVASSNVAEVGYDPTTQTLEVLFRNGGLYRYAGVPPETAAGLVGAKSVGGYLHAHIKPRYAVSKVPSHETARSTEQAEVPR